MWNESAIVLDNGSGMLRAGFAGEDAPNVTISSVVGRHRVWQPQSSPHEYYVGDEAQERRSILKLRYPIERGHIRHWDDMERVWRYTFEKLEVASEDHPILMTEPAVNPRDNQKRMIKVLFEKFNAPAIYLANQGVLSLQVCGSTTGVVLSSGDGVTQAIPVYEGHALPHAVQNMDWAGRDLTDYLRNLLTESGIPHQTLSSQELMRDMKEEECYVALDFTVEMDPARAPPTKRYNLPDGQHLYIGRERFRCPEALFQPLFRGARACGIHEMVYNSIMSCDEDIRNDLFANIMLSGGSTMYSGMAERMQREVAHLAPPTTVKVRAPLSRNNAVWIGGSTLAYFSRISSSFQDMWITREDYNDFGDSVVDRKCL